MAFEEAELREHGIEVAVACHSGHVPVGSVAAHRGESAYGNHIVDPVVESGGVETDRAAHREAEQGYVGAVDH